MGFSKKVGSTEAKQAYLPTNLYKREVFGPHGVNGCERRRLINIGECGIEVMRTDRKYGHSVVGLRVVKPNHYQGNTKLTVLMGIEAGDPVAPANIRESVENPRRYS